MSEHPQLEESIRIQAAPQAVWDLVGDPANYPRWSPMTVRTVVRGGPVAEGSRMINLNRLGWRVWPTRAEVTAFEPGRRIAFRIRENRSTWSYTVAPDAAGTRLTLRRDTDEGISGFSLASQRVALGGEESFTRDLREGIHASLAAIKAEAEAPVRPGDDRRRYPVTRRRRPQVTDPCAPRASGPPVRCSRRRRSP